MPGIDADQDRRLEPAQAGATERGHHDRAFDTRVGGIRVFEMLRQQFAKRRQRHPRVAARHAVVQLSELAQHVAPDRIARQRFAHAEGIERGVQSAAESTQRAGRLQAPGLIGQARQRRTCRFDVGLAVVQPAQRPLDRAQATGQCSRARHPVDHARNRHALRLAPQHKRRAQPVEQVSYPEVSPGQLQPAHHGGGGAGGRQLPAGPVGDQDVGPLQQCAHAPCGQPVQRNQRDALDPAAQPGLDL